MNETPSLAEIPRKVTLADLLDQRIATQCKRLGEEMPVFALLMTGNLDLGTLAKTMQQGGDDGCKEGMEHFFLCLGQRSGIVEWLHSVAPWWEEIFNKNLPTTLPDVALQTGKQPLEGPWYAMKGVESMRVDEIIRQYGGWEQVLATMVLFVLGFAFVWNVSGHFVTGVGDWWASLNDEE